MTFSEKLKKMRNEVGLSQQALADCLHVSRQAVTKWENDLGMPDMINLKAISQLFNVSIDFLLDNIQENPKVVLTEDFDLNDFDKNKYKTKYIAFETMLKERYPNTPIHQLTYIDKKRNPAEKVIDFLHYTTNVTFFLKCAENIVDAIKNAKLYYLIDKQDYQLFIAVEKKQLITTRVKIDIHKNSFYINNIQFAIIRKNI
ncbi:MAG: helix-turn-helix transcriptional regulator [Erysipelotrichaceae bacterium]|nr:helix-turn-helix transcriptional regulator [Erysipelotrichaceae bacterium]